MESRSRAEQQISHESFVAEQANVRATSLRSEVESLQAQIHTIRDSGRQRLSTFSYVLLFRRVLSHIGI